MNVGQNTMRPRSTNGAAALLGAILCLPGCASVMSGRHTEVAIDSQPGNAHVSVYNRRGQMVASAETPAVVTLRRGDSFFRPARYTAKITKPGYETAQVPIKAGLNPWVLGNVVFGGVAGLVVDPFTGAGYRLPSEIRHDLAPLAGPQIAQVETPTHPSSGSQVTQTSIPPVHDNQYPSTAWNGPALTR